jgi:AbrB family looped-hinge helix DNA binding protein
MKRANLTLASNGRLVIPAAMRAAMGCQDGGRLVARLVDGTLVLEPIEVAIRRAQAMVRQYIPRDAGLADELVAERHLAAEHE